MKILMSKGWIVITDLHRLENEDFVAWKIRCCLAKKRKETDMDWIEIRDMLGLDITPDQLRKQAVGYEEYDNLVKDLKNTNEKMVQFAQELKKLI